MSRPFSQLPLGAKFHFSSDRYANTYRKTAPAEAQQENTDVGITLQVQDAEPCEWWDNFPLRVQVSAPEL